MRGVARDIVKAKLYEYESRFPSFTIPLRHEFRIGQAGGRGGHCSATSAELWWTLTSVITAAAPESRTMASANWPRYSEYESWPMKVGIGASRNRVTFLLTGSSRLKWRWGSPWRMPLCQLALWWLELRR